MQDKKYGGYGHLLDDEQKKEVDKVRKSVAYVNQNIKLVQKLNEANHNYQDLRRKALVRRNYRLNDWAKQRQAEEKKIRNSIGLESFKGDKTFMDKFIEALVWVCVGFVIAWWLK